MAKRDSIDELFGCNDLGDCLGEKDMLELGASDLFKSLTSGGLQATAKKVASTASKAASTILDSPIGTVASMIPGAGSIVSAAKTATGVLSSLGGSGGGKAWSPADVVRQAQAMVKQAKAAAGAPATPAKTAAEKLLGAGKVAAKLKTNAPAIAKAALAAPVPMQPSTPVVNLTVQPYGQSTKPAMPSADSVARKLEAKIGGDMAAISNMVRTLQLQNQATSEHNAKVKELDFQRQVINSLKRIAAQTK